VKAVAPEELDEVPLSPDEYAVVMASKVRQQRSAIIANYSQGGMREVSIDLIS